MSRGTLQVPDLTSADWVIESDSLHLSRFLASSEASETTETTAHVFGQEAVCHTLASHTSRARSNAAVTV